MGFSNDISKFVKKAKGNESKFIRLFSQNLAFEIVKATPVDTGFLRSSWSVSINSPEESHAGRDTAGNEGAATSFSMDRIVLTLTNAKIGDILYLINTADYGVHVEFGTSTQAGQAFVRNTVGRADTIANQTLREIIK